MADEKVTILTEEDLDKVNGGYTEVNELYMICSSCHTTTKWIRGGRKGWKCSDCNCEDNWTIYQYNDWRKQQGF